MHLRAPDSDKHQLDEIEKQIEKYERKLEEIKALRSPWVWME